LGTTDRAADINITPHYTDRRFKDPQTIYCATPDELVDDGAGNYVINGCHYDYSDRLYQWDNDKATAANDAAIASGHKRRTAEWCQSFIDHYYDKKVKLVHIIAGVNHSDGYPYCVFGTISDADT